MLFGLVRWNIRANDPAEIALNCLGGTRVINPLVPDVPVGEQPSVFRMNSECCHVLTRGFVLAPTDEQTANSFTDLVNAYLRTVRLVSRQAALPQEVSAFTTFSVEHPIRPQFPAAGKEKGKILGAYRVHTALTFDSLKRADALGLVPDIPLAHEILLDALHAYELKNHREAILFGAISVEALARMLFEKEHSRISSMAAPPAHLNVMTFPRPGGATSRKDPIYALLAEPDSFARLLHEIPLYLFRRSLLQDNQELYRRAVNLYRTRNRLGHGFAIEDEEPNLFPITHVGALEALDTAVAVFGWFGESGFAVPRMNSVPFGGE